MDKINIRLAFSKKGRAIYISHLDLMRVFQRAFYRAQLPLRYTEGFNPHAYLSVALPLPLGMESLCERLDFGVKEPVNLPGLPDELNRLLPEGIEVSSAEIAMRPCSEIGFVEVSFGAETACKTERLNELFASPVFIDKRTKKGVSRVDITTMIKSLDFREKDGLILGKALISAQNPTLNPEYIENAVREYADPEAEFRFTRIALLDTEGNPFDGM